MNKRSELIGLAGTLIALAAVAGAAYSGTSGGVESNGTDAADNQIAARSFSPKTHNCAWTGGGFDRLRSSESTNRPDSTDVPVASVTASL